MDGRRSWRVRAQRTTRRRRRDAEARVARVIADAAGFANETLDLRSANGSAHLWLAGSHNHRDDTVTGLFRSIAETGRVTLKIPNEIDIATETAPGSYGVMYVLDDDASCTWERLVMRRGTVSREADTSLSPHIGVVEDPPGP
jgi:hypothetical protein